MPDPPRQSPVRHLLEASGATMRDVADGSFAVAIQSAEVEARASRRLALCDLSPLRKLGVKGRGAAAWLAGLGVAAPDSVFDTTVLPAGGIAARVGANEFFLEDGIGGQTVRELSHQLDEQGGEVRRVDREDATFVLLGAASGEVLAQTCGIDFRQFKTSQLALTRIAAVSCAILKDSIAASAWRIWVDPSYAEYLWEALVEISQSLDGEMVGAGCLYPELLR